MTDLKDAAKAEHLLVLVHGLWGKPVHLTHLRETIEAEYGDKGLHVLVPNSNAEYLTYDGIELGGERVTNEIEERIKELEEAGAKLSKISVLGYSLGGLVARYAIGLLYKNGIFDKLQPINFTTFATPHLGVRTPSTGFGGQFWNNVGSKTLSTSGAQMFLADTFRDSGKPLLAVLADPDSIFIRGLRLFKKKSVYANTINDRSVPFYTSCISRTDPFVDLDAVDLHYLPDQSQPVILDPSHPVSPRAAPEQALTLYQRTTRNLSDLPFYAAITLLLPIGATFFFVNAGYQSYKSAQRVRLHEAGQGGFALSRYRIPLLEQSQAMQDRIYERLGSQQNEQFLPTPPPEPASSAESSTASTDEKELSKQQSTKEDSPFPILALTKEQFAMIDSLNDMGLAKYPCHISKVRHTHAAIVVRTARESFAEGKEVSAHWAREFEV